MSEHDHAHAGTLSTPITRNEELAPGRASKSSAMDGPTHPIVSGLIARKAERDGNGVADSADQAIATAASSSGMALPTPIMRKFESSLGTDLSSVRVHTGAESQSAASAVGAKAYTMGQDIHFGAGQFNPSSGAGEHLLAHEVAHTVQQRGGSPTRQNKLNVSSPGDSVEYEADRAADAMVSGASTHVTSANGVVYRDKDPAPTTPAGDDKSWASANRTQVEALQNAITAAMAALNADASAAVVAFRQAQATFTDFETQSTAARTRFTSAVKEALEKEKELEEAIKTTFEVALLGGVGGEGFCELVEITKGVGDKIATAGTVVGFLGPAAKKPEAKGDPGPAKVDWKGALDKTLTTLDSYAQQNSGLAALASACITSDRWLTSIVEGKGPAHAQQSAEGIKAAKLAAGTAAATASLTSIGAQLAATAQQFAAGAKADFTQKGLGDPRKIEQDIAIRWLGMQDTNANGTTKSGFGGRGSSDVHAAQDYLEKLDVLGKGSRSGVDAGMWDTDSDDDMIVARAKVESAAMAIVGQTAEWQGGAVSGSQATGKVVANNELWKAVGPAQQQDASMGAAKSGLTATAGGQVRIVSYTVAPISDEAQNAPQGAKAEILHGLVTLTVQPIGPTGGGAVGIVPTISPAPSSGGGE